MIATKGGDKSFFIISFGLIDKYEIFKLKSGFSYFIFCSCCIHSVWIYEYISEFIVILGVTGSL